ncbi:MAG: N-acetyl-D-Glu racemase DgcA [Steroidobacteraceae bacterium]
MRTLELRAERWALREPFRISRGVKTHAEVVVVEIRDGRHVGRGECVPYARYGETVASVLAQIEGVRASLTAGLDRPALQRALPAGAARNALDCALWDLESRQRGQPVWRLAGLAPPRPLVTAYTLSLDTPTAMGAAAMKQAHRPLLKLKLDSTRPVDCVRAVREAAPRARLIVDANEAWSVSQLREILPTMHELGVELIEQPLPAGHDEALAEMTHAVPLAADESCHTAADLPTLRGRYEFVNIKLDKTGGLTEALTLWRAAREEGFGIFVGCMVASSLAILPALLLGTEAQVVDLDGPLLLTQDRAGGVVEEHGALRVASPALWGEPAEA